MKIQRIAFQQFRNLLPDELLPHEGMNVIYGQNAQGKTNLLEAIWLFTGGRSFRGSRDAELIAFGQEQARLELDFFSEEREQNAVLTIRGKKRAATINGVETGGVMELVGKVRAVIFSPEHLSLVKEGPALRRSFLDGAICQWKPVYTKLLFQYNRILQQRNALLKDIPRHAELLDTLDIWDEKLAQKGGALLRERTRYVQELTEPAARVYGGISQGREAFSLRYRSLYSGEGEAPAYAEAFREALGAARRDDLSAGFTTVGPHRDDLDIFVDGRDARAFASQGQQRSCVLALKLAEAELLEQLAGEPPVVLLDDVMSELDAGRQDYLLYQLGGRQVFMTCCELEAVARFSGGGRFQMEAGRLTVR